MEELVLTLMEVLVLTAHMEAVVEAVVGRKMEPCLLIMVLLLVVMVVTDYVFYNLH